MKTPGLGLIAALLILSLAGCGMPASPPPTEVPEAALPPTSTLTATPAPTPVFAPSPSATVTPIATAVPTYTPTPTTTATASPTPSITPRPTSTPTGIRMPTTTRTRTRTATPHPALTYISRGARQKYAFEQVLGVIAGKPELISSFSKNNITFADDPENNNQSASLTYRLGQGDCEDFAQFACTALYAGGWAYASFDDLTVDSAAGLDVQWGAPTPDGRFPYGHAVCLYRSRGAELYFFDNLGIVKGPFSSVLEAVQRIAHENNVTNLGRYTFFNRDFQITFEYRF